MLFVGDNLIISSIYFGYFIISKILLFLVFLIIAILLTSLFRALVSLIAVKTQRIGGVMGTIFLTMSFLSGSWIPLNLFPDIVQKIFYFLPFQYMRYFPAITYLGKTNTSQLVFGFLISILWIITFYFLFKFLYKKAIKSFEGQGG